MQQHAPIFFGYEGLGCVYWHMVSKLRLAVLETWDAARTGSAAPAVVARLVAHVLVFGGAYRALRTLRSARRWACR